MKSENQKKYSVYYLSDSGSTPAQIAKELGMTSKEVKSILSNRLIDKNNKDPIKTTSSPVNSKNLMITETSVKGTKNVAIMTKEASEVNDSFKKNMQKNIQSRIVKNAIFKPNNNK